MIDNPFGQDSSGQADPIVLLPAIRPDVALFHAPMADREGNVWIGRQRELGDHGACRGEDRRHGRAAARRQSAGRSDARRRHPARLLRRGGRGRRTRRWPLPLPEHYAWDAEHLAEYAKLAATEEGFAEYLDKHVYERQRLSHARATRSRPPGGGGSLGATLARHSAETRVHALARRPPRKGGVAGTLPNNTFRDEELLASVVADLIGDVRHVAVGNASPIPATAALLARARGKEAIWAGPTCRCSAARSTRSGPTADASCSTAPARAGSTCSFSPAARSTAKATSTSSASATTTSPRRAFPGSFGSTYLYFVVPKVILFRTEHSRRTLVPKVASSARRAAATATCIAPAGRSR